MDPVNNFVESDEAHETTNDYVSSSHIQDCVNEITTYLSNELSTELSSDLSTELSTDLSNNSSIESSSD